MIKTITNTQTFERTNSHTDRCNQPGSFDPVGFTVVPPRRFEDLRVGDVFRAPSRTLTDAPASAFQTVSADNHPNHYDVEYSADTGILLLWCMDCRFSPSLLLVPPSFRKTFHIL
jgi:hypothetical protein